MYAYIHIYIYMRTHRYTHMCVDTYTFRVAREHSCQ